MERILEIIDKNEKDIEINEKSIIDAACETNYDEYGTLNHITALHIKELEFENMQKLGEMELLILSIYSVYCNSLTKKY